MKEDKIQIKGNKDGISAVVDLEKFSGFDEAADELIKILSIRKGFYKNSIIKVIINLNKINDSNITKLKDELFDKIHIRDCIFEDINIKTEEDSKIFNGIYEGKTKFIRKTVRGGQSISYPGNIVIIGDINSGAEVTANGNIIVLGSIKGHVRAGVGGNNKSIIAAFMLQPELLQIADMITRAPDDEGKPSYPEVAKVRDGIIVVEPYLPNKYIY